MAAFSLFPVSNHRRKYIKNCKLFIVYDILANWRSRIDEAFSGYRPVSFSPMSQMEQLEEYAKKVRADVLANMCVVERCKSGGTCVADAFKPLGYRCQCPKGFYGFACQIGKLQLTNVNEAL